MSSNLTMYHYAKCGTCRDALKRLRAAGREPELHDLFEAAPSADEVRGWLSHSGLPIKTFFNVSGDAYRELKLKDKLSGMTEEEQIALLASNGRLVKRPVVTDGKQVTVGFKPDEFDRVWGRA